MSRARRWWPVLVFCLVAIASGWIGVGLDRAAQTPRGQQGLGILLFLLAPAASALGLRLIVGGWRREGFGPRLRTAGPWYAVAILVPVCVGAVVTGVGRFLGVSHFTGAWRPFVAGGAAMLIFNVIKNLAEEFAWRGFLVAELILHRLSDARLYALAAIIWTLWHVPFYGFMFDPQVLRRVLPAAPLAYAAWSVIPLFAMSLVLTELFRISGSLWPGLLLHTVHNSFVDTLQAGGHLVVAGPACWLLSPVAGLIPALLYLAVGLVLRRVRRSRQAAGPMSAR